jgi:flagellar biosynthetic protein FliQ
MSANAVMSIAAEALRVIALLSAPMLLTALALGLAIGMLQAATQIQEMTLSFIPKILGILVSVLVAGPWMIGLLVDFTERLYHQIPAMVG